MNEIDPRVRQIDDAFRRDFSEKQVREQLACAEARCASARDALARHRATRNEEQPMTELCTIPDVVLRSQAACALEDLQQVFDEAGSDLDLAQVRRYRGDVKAALADVKRRNADLEQMVGELERRGVRLAAPYIAADEVAGEGAPDYHQLRAAPAAKMLPVTGGW